MRVVKYSPKVKGFEGTVDIEVPSYPQRLGYIRDCSFQINNKDKGFAVSFSNENIDALIKMIEIAKKHIKSVNIVKKSERISYASFDEMLADSDCDEICQDISSNVLGGFKLGGKQGRS